jgi:general secretion pathway protein I
MPTPPPMTGKKTAAGRRKSVACARRKSAGFTLLEAIMALALVAVAVMPLYGFFSRSLDGLYRAATVNRESEVSLSAITFLSGLNPMERPEGESPFGIYRLRWQSQELVPATDIVAYPRGLGLYQAALYEVTGELLEGQRVRTKVQIRLVGYKRVRELLPFAAPAAPSR